MLRLANDRVLVTGWVPQLGPYFEASRVSVNPIQFGAGVKGKIVASMEAGVPVVTTSIGAEGMNLGDSVEALIADQPAEIARGVVRLLRDDSSNPCRTPDAPTAQRTSARISFAPPFSRLSA